MLHKVQLDVEELFMTPRDILGLSFVHTDQLMTHLTVYCLSCSYVTSLLAYCRG